MEHRALFSSVSLWVHQQESGLQILLFIFFLSYRATQGLNRHPPPTPPQSQLSCSLSVCQGYTESKMVYYRGNVGICCLA